MSYGPTADAAARRVSARLRGYCAVFKGRPRGRARHRGRDAPASCAGLSKLNSMRRARAPRYAGLARSGLVDVPGRSGVAYRVEPVTTKVAGARGAFPIGFLLELPRKEVIQPQLPLRLPCYDFTPVTGPTFDGFLPKGLDHRLRVLPTPVV